MAGWTLRRVRQLVGLRESPKFLLIVALGVMREQLKEVGRQLAAAGRIDDVDDVFDLIAANPPYVKDTDKPGLAADVKHEPDVALFGGA